MSGFLSTAVASVFHAGGDANAIEFEGRCWRWSDLARIGDAIEALLDQAGLGPMARVAVTMRNHPSVAACFVRLITARRCLVTANPSYPDERLAADLAGVATPVVIALQSDWDRAGLEAARRDLDCMCIALPDRADDVVKQVGEQPPGLVQRARAFAAPGAAIEMLTSGTTGPAKRVTLSYRSVEKAVEDASVYGGRGSNDATPLRSGVSVVGAPFAHMSGIFAVLNTITAGRQIALLPKFTVEGWSHAVARHRTKIANAPPAAIRMILDCDVDPALLSSLIAVRTGSAPVDPALAEQFEARYGIPVLQNYSATEFAGAGAGWTLDDYKQFGKAKRGSVGRINPGLRARIVDIETGDPLPYGETGLLELAGPHLGDGSGWLRTTDLAVMDSDAFLWIKGRADNVIIRGGFKIAPDDIVKVMEQHPAIREAAVVGVPDQRLGQVPGAAYLVRANHAAPTPADLRNFLRTRLLPYQMPDQLIELDDLPRTPSMKVSQDDLRKIFAVAPRRSETASQHQEKTA